MQMRLLNLFNKPEELAVHILHALLRNREEILRVKFTLRCPADAAGIELQVPVEHHDLAVHLDVIHRLKVFDCIVQIPDLAVDLPGFVLQSQRIIILPGLGNG